MISIIVPIYNSEKLLNDCITSIVGQDYIDWELLLIDDGSTDSSSDIAHRWTESDSRMKYYRKKNGGVSSARNYGLDRAKGEYIMFLDSDDLCAPTILSSLSIRTSKPCDMALCGIRSFHDGDNIEPSAPVTDNDIQVLNGINNIYQFMDHAGHLHPPYAKLYRQEIIRMHGIRFDESLSLGEDLLFNLDYLRWVKTCAYIPSALYYYHDTIGSLSKTIRSDYADIQLKLFDSKLDFIRAKNIPHDYSRIAPSIIRDMFLSVCHSKGSNASKTDSVKRIKKHRIMGMAWGRGKFSDFLLIAAIRFMPTSLLIHLIR
jgi:glycosyltransferase